MLSKLNNDLSCGRFKHLVHKCKSVTTNLIFWSKIFKHFKAKFVVWQLRHLSKIKETSRQTCWSITLWSRELPNAKMKVGYVPGLDDVMTEHLQYACSTNAVAVVRSIFNIYLKFGFVASHFKKVLFTPSQMEPRNDIIIPNNYQPVTTYNTSSKLMKIIILSQTHHQFGDAQLWIYRKV